jgi:type I restriction enzyme M protein
MDTIKEIDKLLSGYAYKRGADFAQLFDQWLDWTIGWFDPKYIQSKDCNLVTITDEMKADNETFFECFSLVAQATSYNIEQKGWYDAFGSLYEEKVKSGYKASSMGQFFTPEGLCDGLAKMLYTKERTFIYDPACGSGRLPLAMWGNIDKDKFHYFVLGDIDPLSCKMSALNMMLHGMFGIVERRDALRMDFFGGYVINEMCYPFPCAMPSIRVADEQECRMNLAFARQIAPHREDVQEGVKIEHQVAENVAEPPVAEPAEAPTEPTSQPQAQVGQPIQLSLFNLDEL